MKINFNKSIQEYKTDRESNFYKVDNQKLLMSYINFGCGPIIIVCPDNKSYRVKLKNGISNPVAMDNFDFIELHTIKGLSPE